MKWHGVAKFHFIKTRKLSRQNCFTSISSSNCWSSSFMLVLLLYRALLFSFIHILYVYKDLEWRNNTAKWRLDLENFLPTHKLDNTYNSDQLEMRNNTLSTRRNHSFQTHNTQLMHKKPPLTSFSHHTHRKSSWLIVCSILYNKSCAKFALCVISLPPMALCWYYGFKVWISWKMAFFLRLSQSFALKKRKSATKQKLQKQQQQLTAQRRTKRPKYTVIHSINTFQFSLLSIY